MAVFLQSLQIYLQSTKGQENSKTEPSCHRSVCFHEVVLEIMARVLTFRYLNIELCTLTTAELPGAFMFRAGMWSTISKKKSLWCLILGTKKKIHFRTQVSYGNIEIYFLSNVIHRIAFFHGCEGKTREQWPWGFLVLIAYNITL